MLKFVVQDLVGRGYQRCCSMSLKIHWNVKKYIHSLTYTCRRPNQRDGHLQHWYWQTFINVWMKRDEMSWLIALYFGFFICQISTTFNQNHLMSQNLIGFEVFTKPLTTTTLIKDTIFSHFAVEDLQMSCLCTRHVYSSKCLLPCHIRTHNPLMVK